MRKIFLSAITFLILGFICTQSSFAVTRYATCDACGLCPVVINTTTSSSCTVAKTGPDPADSTKTITTNLWPGDWASCAKCLYPNLYPQSSKPVPDNTCKTLIVDPATNFPVNLPKTGRQFTMIGCITSGSSVGGFTGQTGAPTFVQALLNVVFSLAGGLAFLYLMYGGFIILTSQADPERLNYGRRLIYGAIAGIIITLGSVFIVNLVGSGILHIPGFSGASTTP